MWIWEGNSGTLFIGMSEIQRAEKTIEEKCRYGENDLQTNTTHQFVRPAVVPAPYNNTILRFPVNANYDISTFTAFWIVIKIHSEEMEWVANGNHFAASIIAFHVHTLPLAIHTFIFRASVAALTMIRNDIPVIMNFTRKAQTPSGEWHLNSTLLSTNEIFRR
jgi:hypothetical protein